MKIFKKLFFLLTPKEKKRIWILLLMITIVAFLDMVGVASILPFIAVLSNPELIETNIMLKSFYEILFKFGVDTYQEFIFLLGIIVFSLLVISLSLKSVTIYIQVKFVQMLEYSIGKRLLAIYLDQPYSWFLNYHSSDGEKTILSEVQQLINDGMFSLVELIAKGMVVIALVFLLIFANPKLTLLICFILISSYIFIYFILRKYLKHIGEERLKNNELRFKIISEAFGAIKEIKVRGTEESYINSFSNSAKIYAHTQALSKAISLLPRFFLEAIAFGGALLLMLYIMSQSGSFNDTLPILSLYIFAGYRLMPALQQMYASFSNITYVGPSIDKVFNDLVNLKLLKKDEDIKPILLNNELTLHNVNFTYPNSSKLSLKDININIPAQAKVGFIGKTGCGKTTLIDIVLGILRPQKGSIIVDKKIISNSNLRSWQKSIGYVPQNIYLSDDTIAANIAFGLKEINLKLIEKVSKIANLDTFVKKDLPNQYNTIIGERGIRLSGGQRQRIGIARALYHNPQILILDEATSALDNQTEIAVTEALNNLSKTMTIIIIAHRLSTLKNCDKIYLLDEGQIISEGSFENFVSNNQNLPINHNIKN